MFLRPKPIIYHSPFDRLLTCDSRSKGYGEHKQQVRWYIEYKKKESDQMKTNATVGYPPNSFSLYSFTINHTSSPTDINDFMRFILASLQNITYERTLFIHVQLCNALEYLLGES